MPNNTCWLWVTIILDLLFIYIPLKSNWYLLPIKDRLIFMFLYWFLDLGILQLCAHFLGSLAFKEFARENNVLLKMPSFIWCGNFLCRNILLKTILNQDCFLFLFYVFYFLFIFLFSISILCFYFSSQPRLFSNNMTLILQDYLGT